MPRCVFKEFAAKCATHNLVELLHHKFVAVHLVHFLFALTDGALAAKAFDWSFSAVFFYYILAWMESRGYTEVERE